jgi:SAM-dependent methyltransferase
VPKTLTRPRFRSIGEGHAPRSQTGSGPQWWCRKSDTIADPRSHDVAWSLSTVHHWPDLMAGLAEVGRVLTTGGCFLATERRVKAGATGDASHGWTTQQAEQFAQLCELAGFGEVKISNHDASRGVLLAVLASPNS